MTRPFTLAAVLLAAAVFLLPNSTQAAANPTPGYDQAQIDGICYNVVTSLWSKTDDYFHAGDYPRTVGLDRIITAAEPNFQEAYATGGWLLESMGQDKDAEVYYKQGIASNPKSSYMYYSLGFFYYNTMHDYKDALATFQADVKTPTADVNDWKMLAHTYERLGQLDNAVDTWKQTKKLYPKGPAVDFNLSEALRRQAAAHAGGQPQQNTL